MKKSALIILAEGFEEIEAITPIDILRRAGINITIASLHPHSKTVTGSHQITIHAEKLLDEHDTKYDAVILPGGMPGSRRLAESPLVKSIILDMHKEQRLIAAICAAPALVLAPTGILNGKKATCYPGEECKFSKTTTFSTDDVVIDSNIITSRAAGTSLAFSLAIVTALVGQEISTTIKNKILAS